ncbi:hypothetical protein AJ88_17095 [Mesorhizobium amorphae CCBAU 01583]|nr:hypothetical protein AJ88_17095 [Mesorhizobium amorphae CCBAU 01583]
MIDADLCLGCYGGLGVQGDAGAGEADHVEVVGAVTDGNGIGRRQVETGSNFEQRFSLGGAAKDRLGDEPGEEIVLLDQPVGTVFLEAELGGDATGEDIEAAGDSAVQAPLALMVWTSARPPEANVSRLAIMRSTTAVSRPFSRLTRSRKAGSKAISPFIDRAVIAATRSLTPISSASSSIHSWSIIVESMSASRIFFLLPSAGCTMISTGSEASAVRSPAVISPASACSGKTRSQAMSLASQ